MDFSLPGSSFHGDSWGKNTVLSWHSLLLGIFPIQGMNPGLLHCRWILYQIRDTKGMCHTKMGTIKVRNGMDLTEAEDIKKRLGGAVLRWQRNGTGSPLSPPQIHQKIIWTLSKFHKTASEHWQRPPGTQKGSLLSSKGGRTKCKR